MLLGISQHALENEYYMVDIPKFIERKHKEKAAETIMQIQIRTASNNRIMPDDHYANFVRSLTKNLGEETKQVKNNKLDRHALEALRLMTNQGANMTGGR